MQKDDQNGNPLRDLDEPTKRWNGIRQFKSIRVTGDERYFITGTNYRVALFVGGFEIYGSMSGIDGYCKLADVWEDLPNEFKYEVAFHLDWFK